MGVDTIAEEAGTNKMTLYRHFGSKDDLIVECLRSVALEARKFWIAIEVAHPDEPLAQLNEWIDFAAKGLASDCRGCDLTNARGRVDGCDHPAHRVIEEFKAEHPHNWLAKVCAGTGIARPDLLADTLTTLLEGARVARQSDGSQGTAHRLQGNGCGGRRIVRDLEPSAHAARSNPPSFDRRPRAKVVPKPSRLITPRGAKVTRAPTNSVRKTSPINSKVNIVVCARHAWWRM